MSSWERKYRRSAVALRLLPATGMRCPSEEDSVPPFPPTARATLSPTLHHRELPTQSHQRLRGRQAGRAPRRAARAQTAHETKRARLRHPNVSAQRFFQ
jgi:hypothetical protein